MKLFHSLAARLSVAALLLGGGIALAQTYPAPTTPTIGTTDVFQNVVAGQPQAATYYSTAAQIAGVPGYTYQVPVTAFTITFGNSQTDLILNPAGTLATGTLTTAPNPSDGQRECVLSSQTQTALTWNANSTVAAQTIVNPPTALVANTPVCMTFVRSLAAWQRSP